MVDATQESRDDLPCPWLRMDAAGRVAAGNAALAGLLACDLGAILATGFDSWLTPASRVLFQSLVQPLLKLHGRVSELALSVRTAEGASVDVLYFAWHQADGAVSVQLVPIRQRRRIENELLRIKRAADQAPGIVFQLEQIGEGSWRFPYVSDYARQLYGVTAEEAARSAEVVFGRWRAEDRHSFLLELDRATADGSAFRALLRVDHLPSDAAQPQTPRWHEVQGRARHRRDGSKLWHGYISDVTERVTLQEAIVQRRALERLAHARSEFIARVSHELRTPLNGILGFAQLLMSDVSSPLGPAQQEGLSVILESGRHLLGVVNQLLDISHIETGLLEVALQPVATLPVVEQVFQLMQAGAREKGVELLIDRSTPFGTAVAEPQRLRQVLLNLVSNAIKYNRPGGRVVISAWSDAREVGINIEDTGAGLNQQQVEELFQPFNRLGAERTAVEGAGLGLVVCQHLVALMGGRISVRSAVEVGSTFGVVLSAPASISSVTDAKQQVAADVDVALNATSADAIRGHVLYVEDNPVNALLMESLLTRRPNVTLDIAVDCREAVICASRKAPSLLLIDMHLPDGNGVELLRQLRQLPSLRSAPAIVVSASAGPEAEQLARDGGFDSYWTKPLDLSRALVELDHWLALEQVSDNTGTCGFH